MKDNNISKNELDSLKVLVATSKFMLDEAQVEPTTRKEIENAINGSKNLLEKLVTILKSEQ